MKICRQSQISKIKNKGLKCFTLKIEAAVKKCSWTGHRAALVNSCPVTTADKRTELHEQQKKCLPVRLFFKVLIRHWGIKKKRKKKKDNKLPKIAVPPSATWVCKSVCLDSCVLVSIIIFRAAVWWVKICISKHFSDIIWQICGLFCS